MPVLKRAPQLHCGDDTGGGEAPHSSSWETSTAVLEGNRTPTSIGVVRKNDKKGLKDNTEFELFFRHTSSLQKLLVNFFYQFFIRWFLLNSHELFYSNDIRHLSVIFALVLFLIDFVFPFFLLGCFSNFM